MANDLVMRIIMQANDRASQAFERISNASNSLSDSLRNQKHALREAEKAQKNFDKYKKTIQELRQTSSALRETQERIKELNRVQQQNGSLTQDQARELQQLRTRASQLASTQTQLRNTTQNLRNELQQSGINTRNLSQAQNDLRNRQENATRAIERQRAALERLNRAQRSLNRSQAMSSHMKSFGTDAMLKGGIILTTGASALAPAVKFEKDFSRVQALLRLDKDKAEDAKKMAELRKQAIHLGVTTAFSAGEVAQGQGYLAMAGFNDRQILNAMPATLNLATAAGMGDRLGDVSNIMSNIMSGFGIAAEKAEYASDVLVSTFTSTNTNLEQLGETAAYAAPIMKAAGQSYESTLAMAGLLGNIGIQGSMAGTTLKNLGVNLVNPKKVEELNNIGVKTVDKKGNLREIPDILADIGKAIKTLPNAKRLEFITDIFGKIPLAGATELIHQLESGQAADLFNKIKNSQGATQITATIMADNVAGDIVAAQSALEGLSIAVFDQQNSAIRTVIQSFTELIKRVEAFIQANPQLFTTIVKWTAIAATAAISIGAISIAIGSILVPMALLKWSWLTLITNLSFGIGIISKITLFFKGTFLTIFAKASTVILKFGSLLWAAAGWIGKGIMLIGRAFLMNPIGLSITAIIGVLYLLWRNWDTVKEAIITGWTYLSTKLSNNYIVQALNTMINYFQVFGFSWQSVKTLIILIWTSIKISINQAIDSIAAKIRSFSPSAAFQSAFAAALAYLRGLGGQMTAIGASIIQGLINGIQSKISQVSSYFSQLRSMVSNFRMPSLPSIPTIATITKPAGFSTGGYTGAGGVNEPAGIAHRGEVIFSQADVKRFGGWQIVEKLRTQGIAALTNLIHRHQASQLLTKIRAAKPMLTSLNLGGISGATIITAAEKLNAWLTGKNHTPTENHVPTIKGVISSQTSQQSTHLSAPTHIAGDTITIHLHAAPNMDIKTIADTIIQQLNKQKLAKQRRANSSFIDKD